MLRFLGLNMPSKGLPMAEEDVEATTSLEQLLDSAASGPWVDLTGIRSEELVATLNQRTDRDTLDPLASAGRIAQATSWLGARLASQGRVFFVDANEPGRIGILTAEQYASPVEALAGKSGRSTAPTTGPMRAGTRDRLAGAADMLALNLNQRDSIMVLATSQNRDYAQAAVQSARRSGALAIEISAGTETSSGVAEKLLVNLTATVALARSGRPGRTAFVDLHISSTELQSSNELVVIAATGVESVTAASPGFSERTHESANPASACRLAVRQNWRSRYCIAGKAVHKPR